MSHGPNMTIERRRVPRQPVHTRANAVFSDGTRRGCTVRDLSPHGARLIFGAVAPLPLRFELEFPNGKRVKLQVIWQSKLIAGVRFDRPLALWKRIGAAP